MRSTLTEKQKQNIAGLVRAEHIRFDEPMQAHTTFRVGGAAEVFITPTEAELRDVLSYCRISFIETTVLGNGSNVLVSDEGISGVVLRIGKAMGEIDLLRTTDAVDLAASLPADNMAGVTGDSGQIRIRAGAGASLAEISQVAAKNSLAGTEFASGIPGSFGGAILMNAGAYGGEMKDILENVTVLTADGTMETYAADELNLGYRHSALMETGDIILSGTLTLARGDESEIRAKMKELNQKRVDKQPLDLPSAGSTFKRPEGYFAGKLIEDAGLRGYTVGGAKVSEKHCGFVVNFDHATARDIHTLITIVQKKVYENSGVQLEPEVRFLGDF